MNILQRTIAALTRQVERENKVTSVNTAEAMTVKAEPDWKAIAGELASAVEGQLRMAFSPSSAACRPAQDALSRYQQAAKQVKP
jgi:hypothetical protein